MVRLGHVRGIAGPEHSCVRVGWDQLLTPAGVWADSLESATGGAFHQRDRQTPVAFPQQAGFPVLHLRTQVSRCPDSCFNDFSASKVL